MKKSKGAIAAAIALFFVSPFVAEFLLGNISIRMLVVLVVLAPMYGGGALLIREMVRSAHRGWPSILLCGAAYTLIEEGFTTQSLFNLDYLKLHMHLLDHAFIATLGIGGWWTVFMFNVHAFWSIGVSIALVEALVPRRATEPWLGPIGKAVVSLLFLFGVWTTTRFTLKGDSFLASKTQFATTAVLCVVLVGCAFLLPGGRRAQTADGKVPSAWAAGGFALILGTAVLTTPSSWNWMAVAALLAIDLTLIGTMLVFSRRPDWTPVHTLSIAAGGALAYGLHAFIETPVVGGAGPVARVGNVVFLGIAVALIVAGARRTSALEHTLQ